jgi:acetyltransferase-like isoleucine patch superfamily enzyme
VRDRVAPWSVVGGVPARVIGDRKPQSLVSQVGVNGSN